MFKLWKTNFCGSSNLCLRPSDLLLLFAGSRLLPQLFSFHLTSSSDDFKSAPGLPYSSPNSISATYTNEVEVVEINNLATSEQNTVNVEAALPDFILVTPLKSDLSESNVHQLTATTSETNRTRGTFSECTEIDSVDNVSCADTPSDHELVADLTGATSDAVAYSAEKPATRQRKRKRQSLAEDILIAADTQDTQFKRRSKKKSATEEIGKSINFEVVVVEL